MTRRCRRASAVRACRRRSSWRGAAVPGMQAAVVVPLALPAAAMHAAAVVERLAAMPDAAARRVQALPVRQALVRPAPAAARVAAQVVVADAVPPIPTRHRAADAS